MNKTTLLAILSITTCFILFLGCGGSNSGKETVSGEITWDGQPLASGQIIFDPVDEGKGADAGKIVDGKFSFESLAGTAVVRITSNRVTGKTSEGAHGEKIEVTEQFIPQKYNKKSELEVDIPTGGKTDFKFDLTAE